MSIRSLWHLPRERCVMRCLWCCSQDGCTKHYGFSMEHRHLQHQLVRWRNTIWTQQGYSQSTFLCRTEEWDKHIYFAMCPFVWCHASHAPCCIGQNLCSMITCVPHSWCWGMHSWYRWAGMHASVPSIGIRWNNSPICMVVVGRFAFFSNVCSLYNCRRTLNWTRYQGTNWPCVTNSIIGELLIIRHGVEEAEREGFDI